MNSPEINASNKAMISELHLGSLADPAVVFFFGGGGDMAKGPKPE